jgi:hypothetical protein
MVVSLRSEAIDRDPDLHLRAHRDRAASGLVSVRTIAFNTPTFRGD